MGNSARLLDDAQTRFMSPFPTPALRQAGESHGRLGRAQASGDYMPRRAGAPSPAWPRLAPFSSPLPNPCLSCRAAAVPSRSALRRGCQAQLPLAEH